LTKNLNEFKASSDEKLDTLIKPYDQLWLLVIDEISSIGNRMLNFIDCKLHAIKQVHNQFMGGLDVIMTTNFYQAPQIWDSRIFKQKKMDLIFLEQSFGMKMSNVMNYLKLCDKNIQNKHYKYISNNVTNDWKCKFYLKTPPTTNTTLARLFYTNAKIFTHNKNVFNK
jgi:hypothetical protein